MGSRLLRHTLHHPLREREVPALRHGAVEGLLDDYGRLAGEVRKALRGIADIERIAGRIALRNARPRDLASLRESLARLPELRAPLMAQACPAARPAVCRTGNTGSRARPAGSRHRRRTRRPGTRRRRHRPRLRPRSRRTALAERQLRRLPGRYGGPRTRADRHCQPQGRIQQGAWLLHRGHPRQRRQDSRRLPPPADPEECRALHHAGTEGLRGQGAVRPGTFAGPRKAALRGHPRRPAAGRPDPADHRPRRRPARPAGRLRRIGLEA